MCAWKSGVIIKAILPCRTAHSCNYGAMQNCSKLQLWFISDKLSLQKRKNPSWGSTTRLGSFLTPAMVFSTVKTICEAVTPELRKVATPCVMMPWLVVVKGNTADPKICMSKVRVAVCPAQHNRIEHSWEASKLQGAVKFPTQLLTWTASSCLPNLRTLDDS